MAGCNGGSCGIKREREAHRQRALEAVERAYPNLSCGEPRLDSPFGAGICVDDCAELARRIEDLLPVRVFGRRAEIAGLGDSLYILCGLHRPCFFELREALCACPSTFLRSEETYVRVALSPLGRFATLQETILRVESLDAERLLLTESPVLGIENRDLKVIATGLQALFREALIALLDFAFVLRRPSARSDPDFESRFGTEPTLWSYLFDPAPPTTTRVTEVDRKNEGPEGDASGALDTQ